MNTQTTLLFGRQVNISRTLPGPIERVWGYLTEAELIERWFAVGEIGLSGARVHLVQKTKLSPWDKKGYLCGIVMENEPPFRLCYTIKFVEDGLAEDEVEDSIVEFNLEEQGDAVLLRIIHSKLGREEISRVYTEWKSRLECLKDELNTQDHEQIRQITNDSLAHCFIC